MSGSEARVGKSSGGADEMVHAAMTIGGSETGGRVTHEVINPSTGQACGEVPECSFEDLDRAFRAADAAYASWRQDEPARRDALRRCGELLLGSADELAAVLTMEQGKPFRDAQSEIAAAAEQFISDADLVIPTEVIQDDERGIVEVHRRPVGVVAAITPWNFPAFIAAQKMSPALLAGNSIVLKPSPFTPLTTLRMGQLLQEALPPGVLNVVSGGDEVGRWMSSHPIPRKVTLTGSISAGKHVAVSAAADLKRVTLELGGNDAAILLDDVDLNEVTERVFWGAFRNNGQICAAIKRVYVPERHYADLVSAMAEIAAGVVVGDGFDERTQLGPINNRPQHERVCELVADALANGARAASGGASREGPGYFFAPTIIADVEDGTRIVDEEQFGPVLPLIPYRQVDDAIRRANGTMFGLCGSVWSADEDRASEVASRLECGTVWINTHLQVETNQPFGGLKWSGLGVENGTWGLLAFMDLQVQYRARR